VLNQDSPLLFLFFSWFLLVVATMSFVFWLGRISKDWEGWDYILYCKPILENADERISFVDLEEYADAKYDWKMNECLYILDFIDGLGDAVADNKIIAYGRDNSARYSDGFLQKLYMIPIQQEHWRNHRIEALGAHYTKNNIDAVSRSQHKDGNKIVFVDLHFSRWQARKWLNKYADASKGAHQKKEDKRTRDQAEARKFFEEEETPAPTDPQA
jgi:hypothetical protein